MKKTPLTLIIGVIIGLSVGVLADTLFRASDISYSHAESDATNVDEALTELYDRFGKEIDFSKLELLWRPIVDSSTATTVYNYDGEYTFTDNYRYIIVLKFTEAFAKTVYNDENIGEKKLYYNNVGRYDEGEEFYIYKNIQPDDYISFKITGLIRAGIAVWGIK